MIRSMKSFTEGEIIELLVEVGSKSNFTVDRAFANGIGHSWLEATLNRKKHAEMLTRASLRSVPLSDSQSINFNSGKAVTEKKLSYLFETLEKRFKLFKKYQGKIGAYSPVSIGIPLDSNTRVLSSGIEPANAPKISLFYDYILDKDSPEPCIKGIQIVYFNFGEDLNRSLEEQYIKKIEAWLVSEGNWTQKNDKGTVFWEKLGNSFSGDFSELERFLEVMQPSKVWMNSGCISLKEGRDFVAKSEFIADALEMFDQLGRSNYKVELCADVGYIDPEVHDIANSAVRHKKIKLPVATLHSEEDRVSFEVFKESNGEGAYHLYVDDAKHYGVVPSCFSHLEFTD